MIVVLLTFSQIKVGADDIIITICFASTLSFRPKVIIDLKEDIVLSTFTFQHHFGVGIWISNQLICFFWKKCPLNCWIDHKSQPCNANKLLFWLSFLLRFLIKLYITACSIINIVFMITSKDTYFASSISWSLY